MYLTECPDCGELSLFWSKSKEAYECVACKKTYTETTLRKSITLEICPACGRVTLFDDPRTEKLRCIYKNCGKEFTPEQALVEEATHQIRLAQKPYPELKPPDIWPPWSDPYEK